LGVVMRKTFFSNISGSGKNMEVFFIEEGDFSGFAYVIGKSLSGSDQSIRLSRSNSIELAQTICEKYGVSIHLQVTKQVEGSQVINEGVV